MRSASPNNAHVHTKDAPPHRSTRAHKRLHSQSHASHEPIQQVVDVLVVDFKVRNLDHKGRLVRAFVDEREQRADGTWDDASLHVTFAASDGVTGDATLHT